MTNEERDIITRFIAKFGGATPQGNPWGSVPATQPAAPQLPPIDAEADQLIGSLFAQYPDAKYRITQTAFVQEAALTEAQHRIERLQWELHQAQQAQQQAQAPQRPGLFGSLFGNRPPPAQQPMPPQYAPTAPQPQMLQPSGSGFLGSALHTAAGVAGGVVLGNVIMDMFSGGRGMGGFGGGFGGGGFGGMGGFGGGIPSETVVNNYYGDDINAGATGADPWAGGGTTPDASDQTDWGSQDQGKDGGGFDGGGDMGGGGGDSGGGW